MNTFETPCCVRGYKDIWTAAVGEILFCVREPTNASDRYAVAVTRPGGLGVVIGHLPRKPRFFPFPVSIVLSTSLFTAAIACEGKLADSEPFGSGSPSLGLK